MRYAFLILLVVCSVIQSQAQSLNNFSLKDIGQSMLIVTDGNGKTVNMGLDMENYGSPFFETDFYPANVVLVNGQHYEGVDVKINLLSNEVIFKTDDGKELAILSGIKSVQLNKNGARFLFEFGYPNFEKQNAKTIYQVLTKGETTVLKYFFVQVTEAKPYSSATMLRTIEKFPKLFVYNKNTGLQRAPKSEEDISTVFKNDAAPINKIIAGNKLKIKKEEDLIKCIELFNRESKK